MDKKEANKKERQKISTKVLTLIFCAIAFIIVFATVTIVQSVKIHKLENEKNELQRTLTN